MNILYLLNYVRGSSEVDGRPIYYSVVSLHSVSHQLGQDRYALLISVPSSLSVLYLVTVFRIFFKIKFPVNSIIQQQLKWNEWENTVLPLFGLRSLWHAIQVTHLATFCTSSLKWYWPPKQWNSACLSRNVVAPAYGVNPLLSRVRAAFPRQMARRSQLPSTTAHIALRKSVVFLVL